MNQSVEGIIFDYSTLLVDVDNEELLFRLRRLLEVLKARGLEIIIFSTNDPRTTIDFTSELQTRNLPLPDLIVTRDDADGKSKGSKEWVNVAARHFGLKPYKFVYVGDDVQYWRTAINAGVFYLQATWSKAASSDYQAIDIATPRELFIFLSHYLMIPLRWQFTLDREAEGVHVRNLLVFNAKLAATTDGESPLSRFNLQQILTYKKLGIEVGDFKAIDVLMLHTVSSLYNEGLLDSEDGFPYFTVYPSSTPGKTSAALAPFLTLGAAYFHAYFKPDLLVRDIQASDTSLERYKGNEVSLTEQTNSVRINDKVQRMSKKGTRSVIVFDDFHTTGMSLDWARTLLIESGFAKIILVTIGKYPKHGQYAHRFYSADTGTLQSIYSVQQLEDESGFDLQIFSSNQNPANFEITKKSFDRLKARKPFR